MDVLQTCTRIKIGGIKISRPNALIGVEKSTESFSNLLALSEILADEKINISFLTYSNDIFKICVQSEDASRFINSSKDKGILLEPDDIIEPIALLSLYPSRSSKSIFNTAIFTLVKNKINVYASSTTLSSITFVIDHVARYKAVSALEEHFELPENHAPFEQDVKIVQY